MKLAPLAVRFDEFPTKVKAAACIMSSMTILTLLIALANDWAKTLAFVGVLTVLITFLGSLGILIEYFVNKDFNKYLNNEKNA
jgi:uncharacterized membrane protein